jgi:hypothetical protein
MPYSGEATELQFMHFFTLEGWCVFTPVVDLVKFDMIVVAPHHHKLLSIQVKGKDPIAAHQGFLERNWPLGMPPFDYLIFYQERFQQGLILPKETLNDNTRIYQFNKRRQKQTVREYQPRFINYRFDFEKVPQSQRSQVFISKLREIHQRQHNEVIG